MHDSENLPENATDTGRKYLRIAAGLMLLAVVFRLVGFGIAVYWWDWIFSVTLENAPSVSEARLLSGHVYQQVVTWVFIGVYCVLAVGLWRAREWARRVTLAGTVVVLAATIFSVPSAIYAKLSMFLRYGAEPFLQQLGASAQFEVLRAVYLLLVGLLLVAVARPAAVRASQARAAAPGLLATTPIAVLIAFVSVLKSAVHLPAGQFHETIYLLVAAAGSLAGIAIAWGLLRRAFIAWYGAVAFLFFREWLHIENWLSRDQPFYPSEGFYVQWVLGIVLELAVSLAFLWYLRRYFNLESRRKEEAGAAVSDSGA